MSGYLGDPDAEAKHAHILAENGIHAARLQMEGSVREFCLDQDCGERISDQRRAAAIKFGFRCWFCILCQQKHERRPSIKMLDRIL